MRSWKENFKAGTNTKLPNVYYTKIGTCMTYSQKSFPHGQQFMSDVNLLLLLVLSHGQQFMTDVELLLFMLLQAYVRVFM
jgi:hypothetical protein